MLSYDTNTQTLSWLPQGTSFYHVGLKTSGVWTTIYSGLGTAVQYNLSSGNHTLSVFIPDPTRPPIPPTSADFEQNSTILNID